MGHTNVLETSYLNYFSRVLSIINKFPENFNLLYAFKQFDEICEQTRTEFDKYYREGIQAVLDFLRVKIPQIENDPSSSRYIMAFEICKILDQHIIYSPISKDECAIYVSLYKLIGIRADKPVIIYTPLNTNCEETGIEIHPKFKTIQIGEKRKNGDGDETTEARSLANRDSFTGINGALENIFYTEASVDFHITNAIIDLPKNYHETEEAKITIAFAPLTNKAVVDKKPMEFDYKGFKLSGDKVNGIYDNMVADIDMRIQFAYSLASRHNADILFFPELLGNECFEREEHQYNLYIKKLYDEAFLRGENPPTLVFLPSCCRNDKNCVTAIYKGGKILGNQEKFNLYVNVKEKVAEVLQPNSVKDILVIHIPGVHRIAIMICADYLTCTHEIQRKLFGDLGVTLVLVPSYSPGEQDFINVLPEFKKYGTTVVWGNSCSATESKRIIGGCSIAGGDKAERFSNYCHCSDTCEKGCVFLINIPIRLFREKPHELELHNLIMQKND